MDRKGLLGQAIIKLLIGILLMGVLFVPMYSATVLMFLSMPLILGSLPSFIVMLAYFPIIAKRIRNEEQVLEKDLNGYTEYKEKVTYRLFPYVW